MFPKLGQKQGKYLGMLLGDEQFEIKIHKEGSSPRIASDLGSIPRQASYSNGTAHRIA